MIKIENVEVVGWNAALRGMRNAYQNHDKSDSGWCGDIDCKDCKNLYFDKDKDEYRCEFAEFECDYVIGPNDLELALKLAKAGGPHAKYRRMIVVYADITAPLFYWKEADTYKVGTVANSTSTMHSIHAKKFEMDDFTHENLTVSGTEALMHTIAILEKTRKLYVNYETSDNNGFLKPPKETLWRQMIELLPSSYNQRRTVMLNYEVLSAMYRDRRTHRLQEWRDFCAWIETLPYSELITCGLGETNATYKDNTMGGTEGS